MQLVSIHLYSFFLILSQIIDAVSLRKPHPTVTSLKCLESEIKSRALDPDTMAITFTLSWNYDISSTETWQRFEIYQLAADNLTVFLGVAYSTSYVVSELAIPRTQKEARFIVQAVSCNERRQILRDCPAITISWWRMPEFLKLKWFFIYVYSLWTKCGKTTQYVLKNP